MQIAQGTFANALPIATLMHFTGKQRGRRAIVQRQEVTDGNSKAVLRYFCAAVAIKRPSICSSSIKLVDGDTYSGRISRSLDRTGSAPSTVKDARSSSRLRASNGQSLRPHRTRLIFSDPWK